MSGKSPLVASAERRDGLDATRIRDGQPAARPMGGKRPYLLAGQRDWLLARLNEKPDLTLHALLTEPGARGSPMAVPIKNIPA